MDSYNAYNVIECLVGLARDYHRSVILTIHQPRSNIYALFDQLILLSKGRLVYSGPAQQPVIDHFASLGYACPLGFNIADYLGTVYTDLVDLTMHAANSSIDPLFRGADINEEPEEPNLSPNSSRINIKAIQENKLYSPKSRPLQNLVGYPASNRSQRLADADMILTHQTPVKIVGERQPVTIVQGNLIRAHISDELMALIKGYLTGPISRIITDSILNSLEAAYPQYSPSLLDELRQRAARQEALVGGDSLRRMSSHISSSLISGDAEDQHFGRAGANWADQFIILSGRTLKNLYRNPDLLRTHYAISVIVAFICGLLFWKVDNTLAGFQNRLGVMFFICALFGFQCLTSLQAFASERLIFVRERANRYYSPITYFTSKVMTF